MKKILYLLLIIASCSEGPKTLPGSTGSSSEVIFVVEDNLWEDNLKERVTAIFSSPIEGLNQKEASFKVVHVNHAEFKSILKTHQNIIIIAEGVKSSNQKNKWAKEQLVVQLNINEIDELDRVKLIFDWKERKELKQLISKTSLKKEEQRINENFNVKVVIPSKFSLSKETDNLFWASYNPAKKEEIEQLFVFSFIPSSSNLQQEVLQKTDSVFSLYLEGAKEGQYVQIEPSFSPYFKDNTYRGLWKLKEGFMGGPFLLKTYFVDNKIVVTACLVFAPNSRKRKYIKTYEAIL